MICTVIPSPLPDYVTTVVANTENAWQVIEQTTCQSLSITVAKASWTSVPFFTLQFSSSNITDAIAASVLTSLEAAIVVSEKTLLTVIAGLRLPS